VYLTRGHCWRGEMLRRDSGPTRVDYGRSGGEDSDDGGLDGR
jgi:hypothetical protein